MSKQNVLEIVCKIFGLYCIVQFIRSTPAVLFSYGVDSTEVISISNITLHIFLRLLYPLMFLALSYIFIKKSEFIISLFESKTNDRNEAEATLSPDLTIYSEMHFWIIILGIYYFISAVSTVLIGIWTFTIKVKEGWFILHDPLLPQTIILVLSLICIFRSEQIANIIENKRKKLNNVA